MVQNVTYLNIERENNNEYCIRACITSGNGEPKLFSGTVEECQREMVRLVNFIADDKKQIYEVGKVSEGGFW